MKSRKGLNNKGVTIIELLLVITISLMILVFVMISYNVVNNASATQAAKRMENILRTAKTNAMARGQDAGVVNIVIEGSSVVAYIGTGTEQRRELICNGGVYVNSALNADPVVSSATMSSLGGTITFNTNGRLKMAGTNATTVNHFIVSKGNKMYKIVAYEKTGAIESKLYTTVTTP